MSIFFCSVFSVFFVFFVFFGLFGRFCRVRLPGDNPDPKASQSCIHPTEGNGRQTQAAQTQAARTNAQTQAAHTYAQTQAAHTNAQTQAYPKPRVLHGFYGFTRPKRAFWRALCRGPASKPAFWRVLARPPRQNAGFDAFSCVRYAKTRVLTRFFLNSL